MKTTTAAQKATAAALVANLKAIAKSDPDSAIVARTRRANAPKTMRNDLPAGSYDAARNHQINQD